MKRLFLLTFTILLSINSYSQETGNDSYTIQRLIVYNQNNEILLEQNEFGWMTPALRHNSQETIKDGLMKLGAQFGLAIEMMSLPETKAPLVIRDMTKHLLYYPEIIWGGTFLLSKIDGVISYKTIEQFYSLN